MRLPEDEDLDSCTNNIRGWMETTVHVGSLNTPPWLLLRYEFWGKFSFTLERQASGQSPAGMYPCSAMFIHADPGLLWCMPCVRVCVCVCMVYIWVCLYACGMLCVVYVYMRRIQVCV